MSARHYDVMQTPAAIRSALAAIERLAYYRPITVSVKEFHPFFGRLDDETIHARDGWRPKSAKARNRGGWGTVLVETGPTMNLER